MKKLAVCGRSGTVLLTVRGEAKGLWAGERTISKGSPLTERDSMGYLTGKALSRGPASNEMLLCNALR